MDSIRSKSNTKKIVIARAMLFMMLILISGLVLYMYTVDRMKASETKSINDYKEVMFDRICSEMEMLRGQARTVAKDTANTIESQLQQMNLEQLKDEMDRGVINDEVYDMIINVTEGKSLNGIDNYRNGIIVMTANGILEDYSYERSSTEIRTWENEINTAYNKSLEEEAIHRILYHSSKLIAREKINYISGDHTLITTASEKELKKIFMKEGLSGLENYQILVPAYITETGDIFGQDDIVMGVKQNNHKIIVVQEFNLYDQITKNDPSLLDIDDHVEYIMQDYSITMSIMYLMGLFLIVSVVILLFYFSHLYNYYIGINNLESDEEMDNILKEARKASEEKTQSKKRN